MSSMKKNVLAVALVAGLGMAGAAAAYTYGTNPSVSTAQPGLTTPENVAYQQLFGTTYAYTMTEALIFDIEVGDNAVNYTQGFTVRVALNATCNPHNAPTNPPSPNTNVPTCAASGDGAEFDPSWTPTAQGYDVLGNPVGPAGNGLVLDPSLVSTWEVVFDGYSNNNTTASFRITPKQGITNPQNPSGGTLLSWNNAHLRSLNEFATGATTKVDAEFWMVNPSNDARFVNSTMSRTILNRVSGVTACAESGGSEVDKYIDVADNWNEEQIPKTRFSADGKLGTAADSALIGFSAGRGNASQTIDLGNVTITNNGAGNFAFQAGDVFTTVISGGAADQWDAFDNASTIWDDVYLVNGTCASGNIVGLSNGGQGGTVSGSTVSFTYTGAALVTAGFANFYNVGAATNRLTVCAFQDTNIVIDDHLNHVSTSFTRANAVATPAFNDAHPNNVCDLLPLRYNGSTMEIFTINPGSNTTQRSFVRLTNRGGTDGYVSLEGIDNAGDRGASQVRVWVPAGASVQLDAKDLEDGTNGAIGAWGTGTGKWRAVVTAEFPGLVATSLVNATGNNTLQNITDSDTRGEQYGRDYDEGTFASEPGERPSDFVQEVTPDFHGNGQEDGEPGGPNGSDGPTGGQTTPDGNPGL